MTELHWEGKYKDGKKVAPVRIALPFQTVETINESAADRKRSLESLFGNPNKPTEWRNRLIWGDKKYVLPSLLPEFAGKVNLIYIDPPFDTGSNFSFTAKIADHPDTEEDETSSFVKEPSVIEQKAYRDTWGKGLDSYMQWFYETIVLLRELLAEDGSLYVHLDWHVGHYAKLVLDEPLLSRKKSLSEEIASIDVREFKNNPLPLKEKEIEETKSFVYEGIDILTNKKLLERVYEIPPAQTAEEVVGYYARRIAQNIKLPSQFAALAPKVRKFFEVKAFGQTVDMTDPLVIRAMSTNIASYVVVKEFEKVLRDLIVQQEEPELISKERKLSTTTPFPFSNARAMTESKKTVFNYVTSSNEFEKSFARFLDQAEDVAAFAKLPDQFGFCIQYTDTRANIRNYFPDFIVRLQDGSHWIAETKGREDVDVAVKDRAANNWCEKATMLTGVQWSYIKVLQKEFEGLHPDSFEELKVAL